VKVTTETSLSKDNPPGFVFSIKVDTQSSGMRLDLLLAARLGRLSRMRISNLIQNGACTVNGLKVHSGRRMKLGDTICVLADEGAQTSMNPEDLPLEVVYEDDQVLVLVKPAGMLVHPTLGIKSGTLMNAVAYHLNRPQTETNGIETDEGPIVGNHEAELLGVVRPGLVHRLDRATSGLMVIAKTQRALSVLSRHFHHRLVRKGYVALVHGRVTPDECVIDAPVGRVENGPPHWNVTETGKHAETRLLVLERAGSMTFVELEPVTGRTNQLRIHCAHLGHPIAGDAWYAKDQISRLCLHAARLAFHHPGTGDWMEFVSPVPAEIRNALSQS
jgi:23S rRNA pseudouridine1911/1915/1917 synthase